MNSKIVAGGPIRFVRGRDAALRREIREKYAAELAASSPANKLRIEYRMWREFLRRRKTGHQPSPGSLW